MLVLAGGKGSRLRQSGIGELASTTKMLVEIEDDRGHREPMVSATIRGLERAGFSRIAVLTSDDADAQAADVEAQVLRQFAHLAGLRVLREWQPLGTAGSVYAAMRHVGWDLVLVCPGDTLFPYELLVDGLVRHSAEDRDATWFVTSNAGPSAQNQGRLIIEPTEQRLMVACEGDSSDASPGESISGSGRVTSVGAMLLRTAWFVSMFESYADVAATQLPIDLYRDLIPWVLKQGERVFVHDIRMSAPDLGTADRLFRHGRNTKGQAP
ncbi:NTP transferase domain-containing protein [Mycobacterium adipatum]|uniref:NTP transferase domain-containing protein n=1 Tax=Mycobacterium adipatum TaxID=1682113 RepID=UPI0034E0758A